MMLVICRDYKNCKDKIACEHSKPHYIDAIKDNICFKEIDNNYNYNCACINYIRIRKEKLKQLYNIQKKWDLK